MYADAEDSWHQSDYRQSPIVLRPPRLDRWCQSCLPTSVRPSRNCFNSIIKRLTNRSNSSIIEVVNSFLYFFSSHLLRADTQVKLQHQVQSPPYEDISARVLASALERISCVSLSTEDCSDICSTRRCSWIRAWSAMKSTADAVLIKSDISAEVLLVH